MSGIIVGNRYELIEKIGSGGMAVVYKARCRLLNRFVAIKMLRPEFNDDVEFLKRFETEAQAAASLSHPNIVSVYDVGVHDNIHYIVMEYVEGVTLKDFLRENGPLPIEKIVDFSLQIASALEHAHSKKIIHHDIKPHNIIITESGLLKVTDFGLARAVSASTTVASSGAIGSVHYASPEQARGLFTDMRSDLYSFGITMYEMTTGRVPFDGDTPVAVAIKHMETKPVPPSETAPDVPRSLEKIILKAIEKDPAQRYQSATEMIHDLKEVLGSEEVVRRNEGDDEKFSTKRMPTAQEIEEAAREEKLREEKLREEAAREKERKRQELERMAEEKERKRQSDKTRYEEEDEEEPRPEPKKKKKEDTVAVIAAIATVAAILIIAAATAMHFMGADTVFTKTETPSFLNMTLEEANDLAAEYEVKIGTDGYEESDTVDEGKIISQTPEAGKKVRKGAEIKVKISRGKKNDTLSSYVGWEADKAKSDLSSLGVKYETQEINDDAIEKGYIVKTNPAAGSKITQDTVVMLFVSAGKKNEEVVVPNLTGNTQDAARRILESKKLKLGNTTHKESDLPKGTIIQQSPVADSSVIAGASVDVVISEGKTATPSPSPTHPIVINPDETTENTEGEGGTTQAE